MVAAFIAFGVALAMVLHGHSLRTRDRRLRERLRPIEARLIDPGRHARQELAGAATPNESDDHLPAVTTYFTARWSYTLDGTRYEGSVSLDAPVFAESDVTFGRVQILYDPENPSFSTVRHGARDQGRAWFIGAGVVAVFGLVFLGIDQVQQMPARAARGR